MPTSRHLTVPEAAAALGVTQRHVRRLIADGRLRAKKLDGVRVTHKTRWGITHQALVAYKHRRWR